MHSRGTATAVVEPAGTLHTSSWYLYSLRVAPQPSPRLGFFPSLLSSRTWCFNPLLFNPWIGGVRIETQLILPVLPCLREPQTHGPWRGPALISPSAQSVPLWLNRSSVLPQHPPLVPMHLTHLKLTTASSFRCQSLASISPRENANVRRVVAHVLLKT